MNHGPDYREPAARPRHDAFDGRRKRVFLDALGKCGCLRDAARRAGVSHQTVYNHQRRDPAFARQCELALDMAGTDIELLAWERAVVGVEEPVIRRGEVVGTRLKRSDAMLRLLLQATKRKKYGPHPGFGRKRLLKVERKELERQVRAEHAARHAPRRLEEIHESMLRKLSAMDAHHAPQKVAAGWTRTSDGDWIPPGWFLADGTRPAGDEFLVEDERTPDFK